MAVVSALAAAVSAAVGGGVAGAALGAAVGAGGKALLGGGGKGKGVSGGVGESPATTLNSIKNLTAQRPTFLPSDSAIKPAKTFGEIKKDPLSDPWKKTKDWYEDLGGKGDLKIDINDGMF